MAFDPKKEWKGYLPPASFEEYSERYAEFFKMRREDGIIEVRLHTNDEIYVHTHAAHNVWTRVWQEIGNDPKNHVLILTGTGEKWMTGDAKGHNPVPASDLDPDLMFQRTMDGWKLIESFIYNMDIPTIAAVNGPGFHTEMAVLCDITLSTPDADFMDPHFWLGTAAGDGQGMAIQALMGAKRAAYYIYGAKAIPAQVAKETGLINEIFPREEILDKAWDMARFIMKRPRFTRWATHNILSRHWKKAISEDFGFQMSQQMLSTIASKAVVPNPELFGDTEGRKVFE